MTRIGCVGGGRVLYSNGGWSSREKDMLTEGRRNVLAELHRAIGTFMQVERG